MFVLVDSLYSNTSWRIHACSAVLPLLLPNGLQSCTLYSPGSSTSRDKLCATEGKVNADLVFKRLLHLLLFNCYVGIIEPCSAGEDIVCVGMEQTGNVLCHNSALELYTHRITWLEKMLRSLSSTIT